MIRISPRFARDRQHAYHTAAWMLWNVPKASDSLYYCQAMCRLWRWMELAIYDQQDRARKGML